MASIWTFALDGNAASQRQVSALAEALAAPLHGSRIQSHSLRRGDTLNTLTQPYPDLLINCRAETAALALAVKAASGGKTKVVQIQSPGDLVDPAAFDLIIRQPQETLMGGNVISSVLALHGLTPDILSAFAKAAAVKPEPRAIAVLVGGSDEHVTIDNGMIAALAADIGHYAQAQDAPIYVLTSRRTTQEQTDILTGALKHHPKVRINDARLGYEALLGGCAGFIVTAESLSMVSEALATGRPVTLYDFDGRLAAHPLRRTFSGLSLPYFENGRDILALPANDARNELPALAHAVRTRLGL